MSPRAAALAGLALGAALAAGCGLKGPLYLPEKSGGVVVRPGEPAKGPGTAAESPGEPPPSEQLPQDDPSAAPQVPDDADSAPPPPPENPTPAPPGTDRG